MSFDNEYPEVFARFYDVIYDSKRNDEDHAYYMRKIRLAKGPVLEVGVGTGRLFTEALKGGADIYGIDKSEEMLKVLRKKLQNEDQNRVTLQDLCEFKLNRKFNLVIAPFRVFMHLLTIDEQLEALNRIYKHLNPGGTFIFDLFIPNFNMLAEGITNVKDFDGEYEAGKKLMRFTSMTGNPITQISHVAFRFVWEENGEGISHQWTTLLRLIFRYELEHLLHRSKFDTTHIFGDYQGSELRDDSKDFVVVCKK